MRIVIHPHNWPFIIDNVLDENEHFNRGHIILSTSLGTHEYEQQTVRRREDRRRRGLTRVRNVNLTHINSHTRMYYIYTCK